MLVFTETGLFYSVVKDFDADFLWARSQDRRSIEAVIESLGLPGGSLVAEPAWDYEFRVKLGRADWARYLEGLSKGIKANKIKPAVASALGHDHPYSHAVFDLFMALSNNRPDGTVPGWLRART